MTRRAALDLFAALAALAVSLVVCSTGCSNDASVDRPNIVLVTLDTTRADHLGAYGYFRETSPRFDEFARAALLFEGLVVPMATTLPTHLSILTSSHPLEHGVLANTKQGGARFVPAPGLVSFAMTAQAAGYRTGAFVSAAPLKRGSGIEVGFDHFDQPEGKQRRGAATARAALAWLELQTDAPFFLWLHFYDAHWPFDAPPPYGGRFRSDTQLESFIREREIHPSAERPLVRIVDEARAVANGYDAEILYQDAVLGGVLDALESRPDWGRTAVIVTGDHGEGLCQHGEAAHGGTWHEQLHAPLLIRVPETEPRKVSVPLTSSDILPTLLGLLEHRAGSAPLRAFLETAGGRDVLAEGHQAEPILSQDTGREHDAPYRYALSFGGFKYFRIEHPDARVEERLYDLGVDPHELRDVSTTLTEVLDDMRARTERAIASRLQRGEQLRAGSDGEVAPLDPDVLAELCALGYAVDGCAPAE